MARVFRRSAAVPDCNAQGRYRRRNFHSVLQPFAIVIINIAIVSQVVTALDLSTCWLRALLMYRAANAR